MTAPRCPFHAWRELAACPHGCSSATAKRASVLSFLPREATCWCELTPDRIGHRWIEDACPPEPITRVIPPGKSGGQA